MNAPAPFMRSSIGLKVTMAVTGLLMFLFLITHMLANLQVFLPMRDGVWPLDHYAEVLRTLPELLWLARIGLLAALIGHVVSAVQVVRTSRMARPVPYKMKKSQAATFASRSLRVGGIILLVFIVVHILQFTVGLQPIAPAGFEHGEVQANVRAGFNGPVGAAYAAFYLVAVSALGLHLAHGTYSMFRTLGVTSPAWAAWLKRAAVVFGVVMAVGFAAVPIGVLLGLAG